MDYSAGVIALECKKSLLCRKELFDVCLSLTTPHHVDLILGSMVYLLFSACIFYSKCAMSGKI